MNATHYRLLAFLGTAMLGLGVGFVEPAGADPITVDFTQHGGGDFHRRFFAPSGIVFTQGTFVGFVQGDDALEGQDDLPIAGTFFLTPVTSLSVTVALSLQVVTDFTLTVYDANAVPISTTIFRLNQDSGDPDFMGSGYFTIGLFSLPKPAFSFTLTNRFVRSSFAHTFAAYGVSTLTFTHEEGEAPCAYSFGRGSSGSSVDYCISANGTIVKFQGPGGQEHLAVGQIWEGYVVCTGTSVHAWDLSATADAFGAPTLVAGPTSTAVTLRRSSSQYQLDQAFKLDKNDKDVMLTMTLTNISGVTIPDVRMARAYDPDPNNDAGDDLEFKSASGVWASDIDAVTLTGLTREVPIDTAVDTAAAPACSPGGGTPPAVTGDASLAVVTYRLGNLAPGAKKKVVFVYRAQ